MTHNKVSHLVAHALAPLHPVCAQLHLPFNNTSVLLSCSFLPRMRALILGQHTCAHERLSLTEHNSDDCWPTNGGPTVITVIVFGSRI